MGVVGWIFARNEPKYECHSKCPVIPRSIYVCECCTLFRISVFVPSFSTRWMMKCGIVALQVCCELCEGSRHAPILQVFMSGLCFRSLFEVFRFDSLFKMC